MTLLPGGMLPMSFPSTHTWNVGLSASSRSLGGTEVPGGVAGAGATTTLNSLLRIVAPSTGSVTRMRYSLDVGEFDCFEVGSWADTAATKANTPATTRTALVSLMTQPPFGARSAGASTANFIPKSKPPSRRSHLCQCCQDCFFFFFLLRIRPWVNRPRLIRAIPEEQETAAATNGAPIRGFPSARTQETGVRRTGGVETPEIDSPVLLIRPFGPSHLD